jgi:hypothetical protein
VPKSRGRKKPAYIQPPAPSAPKGNPEWWVPVMVGLMVGGLAWVVVTYLMQSAYPIPGIGGWNLAIGFGLILAGFGMTMRWQ